MKIAILSVLVLGSFKVSAATIVQFRGQVKTLPSSFQTELSVDNYEVKPYWEENRMTIQRLPTSTWDQIKRQPNLAIRISNLPLTLNFKDDPAIERISTDSDLTKLEAKKVQQVIDPILPCENSIYLGEYSAKITQKLTEVKSCDGFWLFPEEDTPYEFSVNNGKTMNQSVRTDGIC